MKLDRYYQSEDAAAEVDTAVLRLRHRGPRDDEEPMPVTLSTISAGARWAARAGPILRRLADRMRHDDASYVEIEGTLDDLLE